MNRRGFFSNLTSVFHWKHEGDPFFFGFQCVINIYGEDDLRARIHKVIAEGTENESPEEKHRFYKRISALLWESLPFLEYGYWDYLTDPDEAVGEFRDWVDEIEASMATEEEELTDEADDTERISNDKNYVVVTLAFLLQYGDEMSKLIGMIESIPEDDPFTPDAFRTLVESVNFIDFGYSEADAVFIMPGNAEDGFSWTDMRGEGWEYLKPIMGTIN